MHGVLVMDSARRTSWYYRVERFIGANASHAEHYGISAQATAYQSLQRRTTLLPPTETRWPTTHERSYSRVDAALPFGISRKTGERFQPAVRDRIVGVPFTTSTLGADRSSQPPQKGAHRPPIAMALVNLDGSSATKLGEFPGPERYGRRGHKRIDSPSSTRSDISPYAGR